MAKYFRIIKKGKNKHGYKNKIKANWKYIKTKTIFIVPNYQHLSESWVLYNYKKTNMVLVVILYQMSWFKTWKTKCSHTAQR